jgi:predicted O-methyltransferase YrrM
MTSAVAFPTMTGRPDSAVDHSAMYAHVEGYLAEDDVLLAARAEAERLGCVPVGPGAGAGLRFLAAAIGARAVVEIGTGTGVSGLWLLRGMAADGVLTSIDVDPEHQRAARGAFIAAGNPPSRMRLINGMGLEVLPRLTDGGYDLVFVDTEPPDYPRYLDQAVRLLRVGGMVVIGDVLRHGAVDPDATDPEALAVREVARQAREDDRLAPLLLPLSEGLLAAVKTGS